MPPMPTARSSPSPAAAPVTSSPLTSPSTFTRAPSIPSIPPSSPSVKPQSTFPFPLLLPGPPLPLTRGRRVPRRPPALRPHLRMPCPRVHSLSLRSLELCADCDRVELASARTCTSCTSTDMELAERAVVCALMAVPWSLWQRQRT